MGKHARLTEPTIDPDVEKGLDALAANPSTAARFLDACDTIKDFNVTLATGLKTAIKRHSPMVLTHDGDEYLVFVIPSPIVMLKSVDTFCIIYHPKDARFHVHRYANCSSMRQYEETRQKMRSEVSKHENVAQVLLDAGNK